MMVDRLAAFGGTSDSGDVVKVYLTSGEPTGKLMITLANGKHWSTQIDVTEIAIFASHNRELMSLYMDEMTRNARAATEARH